LEIGWKRKLKANQHKIKQKGTCFDRCGSILFQQEEVAGMKVWINIIDDLFVDYLAIPS
jgi:hypothetical protein